MSAGEPMRNPVAVAYLAPANAEALATSSSASLLQARIERLQELDGSAMREEWRRLFRAEPLRISRDLLARALAYRLQEIEFGGLPKWARQTLAGSVAGYNEVDDDAAKPKLALPRLKPGARIVRASRPSSPMLTLSRRRCHRSAGVRLTSSVRLAGANRVAEALLDDEDQTGSHQDASDDIDSASPSAAERDRRILLTIKAQLQRAGVEMRFVVEGVETGAAPDEALVRLLTRAHALARHLAANPSITLEEAGAAQDMGAPYAARLMRLNFLAPDIVAAILNGRQPAVLSATKLMADTRLPLAWAEQRKALGFA